MGDKGSEIRIFLADTGEEVAMAKDAQIHLSPTEKPEQDPSVWSPHSYEITGTLTTTPEQSEQFRKFIESMKFNRKELRKMFHAVTHGGAVVIQSHINTEYDNGETEEFVRNVYINRPSILRKLIAGNHGFRFKYDIMPRFDPKDKIILSEFGWQPLDPWSLATNRTQEILQSSSNYAKRGCFVISDFTIWGVLMQKSKKKHKKIC